MITIDEAHSVEIHKGNTQYNFGPYLLNDDANDLDKIRKEIILTTNSCEIADIFENTFFECERYPGEISKEITQGDIKVIVKRYLYKGF